VSPATIPTDVLLDARMATRGLGIATFVNRLVEGFEAHPGVRLSLWGGGGTWDRAGKLATLGRSGLFDVSPALDPRARGFAVRHFAGNMGPVRPGRHSVLTVHDLLYRRGGAARHRVFGALLEQALPRVGRVVAVSARTRDEVVAVWPALARRIEVIPHGLRRLAPPAGERRRVLAFGGGEDPRKRVDLMVAVYAEYRATTVDPLPLVVLGRAGLTAGQAQRLTELGAELVPDASEAEVDRLMATAAAVLYTTTVEGFGLPILEAAEAGTPVVIDAAADVAGEVLGRHCYKVSGGAVGDWAETLRAAVAGGPVPGALDLPDWTVVAGRYAELYREVAA